MREKVFGVRRMKRKYPECLGCRGKRWVFSLRKNEEKLHKVWWISMNEEKLYKVCWIRMNEEKLYKVCWIRKN